MSKTDHLLLSGPLVGSTSDHRLQHPRKNLEPLQALRDTRPVHTCRKVNRNSLLDDTFWEQVHEAATQHRAYLTTAHHEVASYWNSVGQSAREDYHREYAVLYGMTALFPTATKGSLSFGEVVDHLNAVVNVHEGLTVTYRKRVPVEFDEIPSTTWVRVPKATVDACLVAVNESFRQCWGWGEVSGCPPWRVEAGHVMVAKATTVRRPRLERDEIVTEPLPKRWENPNQVEGGFTFLPDTPHHNLRQPGCEGLSVLFVDEHCHLVQWVTAKRRSGYMGKKPLAIQTFPQSVDVDEAITEMHRVAQAMGRAGRYQGDLLPWQAAAMAAEFEDLPPLLTGSHEWLAAIADQRETGERYRNLGAGPE